MDYGNMLDESSNYTKEGIGEKVNRWILLAIAAILLCIPLAGYMMRIYGGAKPAPEVDDWRKLFIDGIMLTIISTIYAIPLFIILFFMAEVFVSSAMSGDPGTMIAGMAGVGVLFLLCAIIGFLLALIVPFALIRCARTGNFKEAFNFKAVLAHIGKVGWIKYSIAMIILAIVIGIPLAVIYFIVLMLMATLSLIGILISFLVILIIIPPIALFQSRYVTQIYEAAAAS